MLPHRTSGLLFLTLALPTWGQTGKVDPAALAKAGRASIERFEKESASWTASMQTPAGPRFLVDVLAAPDMKRWILSVEVQGRREEFSRIIQRDGVWYVAEGPKAGKYRPYEAPFDVATAYMQLTRSDLQFVIEPDLSAFGTLEGTQGGVATYRTPLAEPQRKQLQNAIADFDKVVKENPGQTIPPETVRSMDAARDLLAKGIAIELNLTSGLFVQFGAPERRTRIENFRWLGRADPKEFDVEGRAWEDFTDDPTTGDLDDLLMIGHSAYWRPGTKTPDTDGRLLDLKTGRFRRIPFRGDITLPGCFTKDRARVLVAGADTVTGVIGLFEIDLKTGENRQLGGELLADGFSLFPVLSPDGKTVAVLHKGASERLLQAQICLVDLETGTARPLGKPLDTGPVSWLPDGRGLLIVDRRMVAVSKPTANTICRMDLDGRITKLREGSAPVMLGDGKSILFEAPGSRLWQTCNLDGGDAKLYADGMKGYGFPAPSPDGKRLLMMHFRPGQAPQPLIFPIGSVEGKPATTRPGLWTSPAWR